MPTTSSKLTPQQLAIIAFARDNPTSSITVAARAGTGKTSTLLELLPTLKGATSLQAFNKSIAEELKSRVTALDFATRLQLPATLDISTVHASGLKAYIAGNGRKPRISGGKVSFIQKDMFKANQSIERLYSPVASTLTRLVSAAKNSGFGLASATEHFGDPDDEQLWLDLMAHFNLDLELEAKRLDLALVIKHCQKLLATSNAQREIIDFDDMIYLPLLNSHPFPQYQHVLIDEAQDISPTRRELAFRSLLPSGRVIAVGDEYQAIYGFTGADADSLPNITRRAQATVFPLTTCWRCDAGIIAEITNLVPDITARPDSTPGLVDSIPYSRVVKELRSNLAGENSSEPPLPIPAPGDAILCRLNKPNVSMALDLIRAGRRARIEGRDLGSKLLALVKSSDPGYSFKPLSELIIELESYTERQCHLLASKQRHAQADMLADEAACAVLLMERCLEQGLEDFSDLEADVADLFADDIPASGVITLSSVHKAKGREWPHVFILGRGDYMPFHRAEQPWELQQERNLIYVAVTRAERHLTYITDVQAELDSRKQHQ